MKYFTTFVLILAGLVGIIDQTMYKSIGPEFSITELVIALLLIPSLIISGVAVISGLLKLILSKENRLYSLLIIVLGSITPSLTLLEKVNFESHFDASYAWYGQLKGAGQLNFFIHEMMLKNTKWITYIDDSDEIVDPRPIIAQIKTFQPISITDQNGRSQVLNIYDDRIETPWGAQVYFAIDRDGDGYISALGQKCSTKYGVNNPWAYDSGYSYKRASGILLNLPDPKVSASSSIITLDNNDFERLRPSWKQSK